MGMRRGLTLPPRGRVGARLREGGPGERPAPRCCAELAAKVTPTRRFAATSPLKGEVGSAGPAADLPPCGGDVGGADRGGYAQFIALPITPPPP